MTYVALGSNLGDRRAHLRAALAAISRAAKVERVSSVYRTEPVGIADQPVFYNAVVRVRWRGSAAALLRLAKETERRLGRTEGPPNGPRLIDVDLLDVGGAIRHASDPILPHPRLAGRRFVLAPLAEIAPGWRDPRTGRSVKELLAALPARPWARRLRRRL